MSRVSWDRFLQTAMTTLGRKPSGPELLRLREAWTMNRGPREEAAWMLGADRSTILACQSVDAMEDGR